MKQYKLIKKYPGSPELGTIATVETFGGFILNQPEYWEEIIEYPVGTKVKDNVTGFVYTKGKSGIWDYLLNESEIGKGKRFKIIEQPEKNYEILSFITEKGNIIKKRESDNYFPCRDINVCYHDVDYFLNHKSGFYKIHSIRRLSDDEIFTLGDKVDFTISKNVIITEFKILDRNTIYEKVQVISDRQNDNLNNIKKPKVLFTTEDGVDIREIGTKYWVLNTKLKDWIFEESVARDNINYFYKDKSYSKNTGIYYFSTKEKAEEYILMNKPCLSINEIFENTQMFNLGNWGDALKQLVKSKL